ncbi:glycosyltransferase [Myceligenerans indicum]|uniref:Glycosyltransferase family 1 protein n=1 Tax=Myceligenerans indicum TaxID=2593663 RepID=A0ABS1LLK6_9MICO|nr:glycosyltransferase [Myceligenerans indicum]MBL0887150.1 glycosyltransferase family 1 protein [Myceligenerans indicum]
MTRVLIATVGSRGDVQPYVALARGLRAAGHEPTIATCARFESFVTANGIAFEPLSDDILRLLDSDAGRSAMEESHGALGAIRTNIALAKQAGPINERLLRDVWRAAQIVEPGLVIYHPKALAGPHVAEALGVPAVEALPVPAVVPTGDFPVLGMPRLPFGSRYNRMTYSVVAAGYKQYEKTANRFRTDDLGLAPVKDAAMMTRMPDGTPIEVMHAISEQVLPRPADWPSHARLTGYWFLDDDGAWTPPQNLVDFLDQGDPPVYVGFGSMAGRDPRKVTREVVAALRQAGVRGVLASGWGGLDTADLPDTVLAISEAPHEWIFPRVSAVVHHGGAGTTAAGLRAGRPTVVCPFIVDQFFWGARVADLGAGPSPVPQKGLTADRLAAAISAAVTDPQIRSTAEGVGATINAEDGVAVAVEQITATLARASRP